MILDYIRLQNLKHKRRRFERKNRLTLDEVEFFDRYDIDSTGERETTADIYWAYTNEIRALETEKLRRLADRWDIKIKKTWIDLACSSEGKPVHMLTDEAVETINNTIRQRRRETLNGGLLK